MNVLLSMQLFQKLDYAQKHIEQLFMDFIDLVVGVLEHYSPNKVVICLVYSICHDFNRVLHVIQTLVEGSDLTLLCESDGSFEYCTWNHLNDSCSFKWVRGTDTQRENCANTLKNRIRYVITFKLCPLRTS